MRREAAQLAQGHFAIYWRRSELVRAVSCSQYARRSFPGRMASSIRGIVPPRFMHDVGWHFSGL